MHFSAAIMNFVEYHSIDRKYVDYFRSPLRYEKFLIPWDKINGKNVNSNEICAVQVLPYPMDPIVFFSYIENEKCQRIRFCELFFGFFSWVENIFSPFSSSFEFSQTYCQIFSWVNFFLVQKCIFLEFLGTDLCIFYC